MKVLITKLPNTGEKKNNSSLDKSCLTMSSSSATYHSKENASIHLLLVYECVGNI